MRTEKKTAEGEGETGEAQWEARCEGGTRGASMGGLRIPIVTVAQELNSPPPIGGRGEGGCWSSHLLSALPPNPQRTLLYLENPILQALAPFQAREISWQGWGFVRGEAEGSRGGWTTPGSWLEGDSPRPGSHLAQGDALPRPQGQGRAIYCIFIAWVVCPEPAGGTGLGAWGRAGQRAHTMRPLCLSQVGRSVVPCSLHRRFPAWPSQSGLSEGRACLPPEKEL